MRLLDRLAAEPNPETRGQLMRNELGPWLYEYVRRLILGQCTRFVE